jgi:hypothetical protein
MQLLNKFKVLYYQNPKYIIFNFNFEFLNIRISHLAQLPIITMALKSHHKNISKKIIVVKEFWSSSNMIFGSFDCHYSLRLTKNGACGVHSFSFSKTLI